MRAAVGTGGSSNGKGPIFVVGMPRSGTTLMSSLLSAHPSIAIAPETHFLNHWMRLRPGRDPSRREDFESFWEEFSGSERFSYLGIDASAARARILAGGAHGYGEIFAGVLQEYAATMGKPRWGEKTPNHWPYVDVLLGWYPRALIVYMLRDPRAVVASLLDTPWAGPNADAHASRWRHSVHNLERWAGDGRVRAVKYEALVAETEPVLRRVCEFLDEEYTPVMLDRSETTSPIINRQDWAKAHLRTAQQPVTGANVQKWRSTLSSAQVAVVEHAAGSRMQVYGYLPASQGLSPAQLARLYRDRAARKVGRAFGRASARPPGVGPVLGARSKAVRLLARAILKSGRRGLNVLGKAGTSIFGSRNARALGHWRDYLEPQPIAGYIGWLGHANLGDEAMYLSFKKLFPGYSVLTYDDTHAIELMLYRLLVKRRGFYDFVFLGGGTLINTSKYLRTIRRAESSGHRVVVFGTGVRDPSFWAKHRPHTDYDREMAEWVAALGNADYVSVRGPQSARILESYGLPKPRVIGDPALSICSPGPPRRRPGSSRTVAINVGRHGPMYGSQETVNEVVARVARHLLDEGWQVEFLPMHPIDLRIGLDLVRRFDLRGVSVWREFRNIPKTLDRIRTYDLLVGQRLHAVVLACGCGVPSISLEYRPKCGDFMESIGMQRFSVRTDALEVDGVLALIRDIERDYAGHSARLISACDRYRLLQAQAAREIGELVSTPLPTPKRW